MICRKMLSKLQILVKDKTHAIEYSRLLHKMKSLGYKRNRLIITSESFSIIKKSKVREDRMSNQR